MAIRIAVDVMGGDLAPKAQIEGSLKFAAANPDVQLILVGLPEALPPDDKLPNNVVSEACGSVMAMDESVENLNSKRDSSIWVATKMVKEGRADAIVSCGSTAAQMACALLILGRIKSIDRPAIGVGFPNVRGGVILLDAGANVENTAEQHLQFAIMGSVYAELLLKRENPRIALLSNGSEEHKGREVNQKAYQLLKASNLNFVGNIEGRELMEDVTDVIVTDGYTGNIVLKTAEGIGKTLMKLLKDEVTKGASRKMGAALLKPALMNIKDLVDYKKYGGAPLLGVNGVSIVCHGSSDAAMVMNGLKNAQECVDKNFIGAIIERLAENKKSEPKAEDQAEN